MPSWLALGFSLNNISLFGLVLAIGIVVDDAIVVVENVERWLDRGLTPREATIKAMEEVTGPIIAVALVLSAVFVPCAFISGITGQFFRQFAVTIAVSTMFSAINSLTLSPALAAILLQPRGTRRDPLTWLLDMTLGWFFRLFNLLFGAGTVAYAWSVGTLLRINFLVLPAYGALVVLTFWVFQKAPTGFVPQQDQGRLIASMQTPDSASLERTKEALAQVAKIALETPGVAHATTTAGMSFLQQANGSNFASMFVVLEPFAKRQTPELSDTAIMAQLRKRWFREVKDAVVTVYGAAPIPGLSVVGGFKLMVEDQGGLGLQSLQRQTDTLVQKLKAMLGLTGVQSQFRSNTPQLLHGHRPDQGRLAGRVARRRESDAADLPGLALRQQLQRVRPATGRSTCRPRVSTASASPTSICSRSETNGGKWCRWARWSTSKEIGGPDLGHALQPLHGRGPSTATCSRASAPAT